MCVWQCRHVPQGPSASAYVTYYRSDDALRAIAAVNNVTIENRTLKASLGTTKYCSHFMKNQPCPKTDCMYLHEPGESPSLAAAGATHRPPPPVDHDRLLTAQYCD